MHYIVLLDVPKQLPGAQKQEDYWEKFINWISSRRYDTGLNWHINVRELRLLDLQFPAKAEKQVLSELKYFEHEKLGRLKGIRKLVSFLSRFLPIKPINLKVERANRDKIIKPVPPGPFYLFILGKVEDEYRGNLEML